MDSQRKHLRHIMLHCFKNGNSAKDTADKISTVYWSGATTITTVCNWFKIEFPKLFLQWNTSQTRKF
ncbi:hypothetical protein ANTPLA_LOCUS7746 [Anthophora plagiata]